MFSQEPQHHSLRDYILIVHGTWSGRDANKRRWWELQSQPDESFAHRLAQALSKGPLRDAVWRSYTPGNEFSWSGANTRLARLEAGFALHWEIRRLIQEDPQARVHVVAHSHGGNVLLVALYLLRSLWPEKCTSHIGRFVFLGTPFFKKVWNRKRLKLRAIAGILASVVTAVLLLDQYLVFFPSVSGLPAWAIMFAWYVLVRSLSAAVLIIDLVWPRGRRGLVFLDTDMYGDLMWETRRPLPPGRPFPALVISAGRQDEALLALTSLPLWSTYIQTMVRTLRPALKQRDVFPSGTTSSALLLEWLLTSMERYATFPVRWLLSVLLIEPFAKHTLRRLSSRIATGEPADELMRSSLRVSSVPDIPELLSVTYLDVGTNLTDASNCSPSAWDRSIRQSKTLDETAINALLEKSHLWRQTGHIIGETAQSDEIRHQLKLDCLALEQRIEEMLGAVDLKHSQYYSSQSVIDRVARFLEGTSDLGPPMLVSSE